MVMAQQLVLEERKRRKAAIEFLQWLQSVGGIFLAIAELLKLIGWAIIRIAQFIANLMGITEWRGQYI